MSKFRNIALLSLVVLALSVTGCSKTAVESTDGNENESTVITETNEQTSDTSEVSDSDELLKAIYNETYLVEGEEVTLVEGKAETEIAPDSASKMKTEILGEPVFRYFEDGTVDYAAVILVTDSGGSGTFYYVATPISKEDGDFYISDAIFIGDRIKIESMTTEDGEIVIDYLEHGENQAMSEEPTEAVQSTYIIVDDILNKVE